MSCSGNGGSRKRSRLHLTSAGYSRDIQNKIIDILGGKCSNCFIDDRRVLHTHHINRDGAFERKELHARRYKLFNLIVNSRLEGIIRYKLLCANCHQIESFGSSSFLRDSLIDFLGGKCVRCYTSVNRILQFDFINGKGHIICPGHHPQELLVLAKKGFIQLLCANCNWIKRAENKEY